jgi:hypothetical protein
MMLDLLWPTFQNSTLPTEVWVVTSSPNDPVDVMGAENGEGSVIHFMRRDAEAQFAKLDQNFRKSFRIARALITVEAPEGGPRLRPEIVTLCGSTKFKEQYEQVQAELTLQGKIVISVGLFGHKIGLDMSGPVKKMLDELHLRKIDLADTIFFVNPGGYLGESSRRELAYARLRGKGVAFLEPETAPKEAA